MPNLTHGPYALDAERVEKGLREISAKRVLVQAPLGFRGLAEGLSAYLARRDFDVMISNSACWGGCDVSYTEAELMAADAIVHLGHTRFLRRDRIPTVYVECRYVDPAPLIATLPTLLESLKYQRKIALGASVQWLDHVQVLSQLLSEKGLSVLTAKPSMFSAHEAQVLGCDYSSLKKLENQVDAFVVVGSIFHGLGLALISSKKTYAVDPITQRVQELGGLRTKILLQRYACVGKFSEAKRVGVVVSVKPGQNRAGLAKLISTLLEAHGRVSTLISTDEVDTKLLEEFTFDAYVNTACPRLSIEDQSRFRKPLLLPAEVLVALGLLRWEDVLDRGLLMYPWGLHTPDAHLFWDPLRRKGKAEVLVS